MRAATWWAGERCEGDGTRKAAGWWVGRRPGELGDGMRAIRQGR